MIRIEAQRDAENATARAPKVGLPWPVLLHWSPKSPFVRKVAIVIAECGLDARIRRQRTVVERLNPDTAYMKRHPLGTIPMLELEDGAMLHDSAVICEYLTILQPAPVLLPKEGWARFEVLRLQALVDGMLDALLLWRQERIRPQEQQSAAFHTAYALKARVALDALEAEASRWPDALDLGQIAAGSALAYLDLRFSFLAWRQGRDALAAWHDRFEARPSAVANRLALD
ncbi:glutathione S-transferase family protein [Sphingobium indicum]|uniref:Glutathione S-transferase n=2 Tax=Sphingobium indicum TaxID=332055 RepID=A0A1L5BTC2_SPHIB|nr:glutathione S-transferase family protein [Sphingobium indicum]APL96133.1 glutathione S-transferase [Sphingobium indicum B90A]NYI24094.1 glutathione S-transferase [Sphingobium indicum]RYL99190.1 glutathione S-transferase family protein [Sphingobium indicum]